MSDTSAPAPSNEVYLKPILVVDSSGIKAYIPYKEGEPAVLTWAEVDSLRAQVTVPAIPDASAA